MCSLAHNYFLAERQNCLTEKGSQFKDQIYFEFYGFLSELHGSMKASIRLVKLLALQMDAKVSRENVNEILVFLALDRRTNTNDGTDPRFPTRHFRVYLARRQ